MKQLPQSIQTKFGTAKLQKSGYYIITSYTEGNNAKPLHRLIYEDYYGVTVLPGIHIHHIDGNKVNNNITNLEAMTKSQHTSVHRSGKNHPNYGKKGKDAYGWKDYPTIVKDGLMSVNKKQRYALFKNGDRLKGSIKIKDLINYAKELGFDRIQVLGEMKQLD